MSSVLNFELVDSVSVLGTFLAEISPLPVPFQRISLAVDIEGVDLCRYGRVSIMQIMSNLSGKVWLIDVTTLGREAFDYTDPDGRSLRGILEGEEIRKVFYDVRNDADALFHLYNLDMMNTYDLQLLELAVRHSMGKSTKYVNGLSRSIESYVHPPRDWKVIKEAGVALFAPEKGGSYTVFETRPMDPRISSYCAQDVAQLFKLEEALRRSLGLWGSNWENRVIAGSTKRVNQARSLVYEGQGKHRALAPVI